MDYAGKYLQRYEESRYSWFAKSTAFLNSIIVPPNAVDFPDVSFYQGTINWDTFASKSDAVILRIGQNTWIDNEFETNYTEAKKRGLKVGGYWFFDNRSSSTVQANLLKSVTAGKSFELEIFADWEYIYTGGTYNGLGEVVAFMQAIESVDCFDVGLYTGYYWFIEHSNATTNASQYNYLKNKPLWLAWYSSAIAVKIPPPWTDWEHWQYGTPAIGAAYGVQSAEIDMNRHNGDLSKYGVNVPPPTGENKMYRCIQDVAIRDNNSYNNSNRIGVLKVGDTVDAVMMYTPTDPIPQWLRFNAINRVSGTVETFTNFVYCSGNVAYVEEIVTTPPPSGNAFHTELDFNSDGTVTGTWNPLP